jgi:nucleoside-specific outer membrane channel protein Tsx
MKTISRIILAFFLMLIPFVAHASTWSKTSAELLYSSSYDSPGRDSNKDLILSLKHANGWKYGDNFFFVDVSGIDEKEDNNSNDSNSVHLEWGPRFSLGRYFYDAPWDNLIKDVYFIGQIDVDRSRTTRTRTDLYGISLDLNIPKFNFFKVHFFKRDSPALSRTNEQLTLTWHLPFTIGNLDFAFEGFADYVTSQGAYESNLLTQPTLIWNVNQNIGVGFEYQSWHNKFGINDKNEQALQYLVRWNF